MLKLSIQGSHSLGYKIPGLFQDFPGPGNFTNTIPGLSTRRRNPVQDDPKSCMFFNTPYLWNRLRQNETDFTKMFLQSLGT